MTSIKLAAFFILIIGFEFVHFYPQLINKLLISSIWPLIRSISTPILTCLFQFGPCHNPFLGYSPIHIFSLFKKYKKQLSKKYNSEKRMPERLENGQKLVEEVQKYKN
jgi:hypothetical protein